jgi:hypothetical protein
MNELAMYAPGIQRRGSSLERRSHSGCTHRMPSSGARLPAPLFRRVLAQTLCLLVVACGNDGSPLDPGGNGGDGPPDAQRADLVVTARIDSADAAVAAALGFPGGAIPGAEVTIRRAGTTAELNATADAQGRAVFERLLPGAYSISAVRVLTPQERSRLSGETAGVNALGGGRGLDVAVPRTEGAVSLTAGRPGSLVLSELSFSNAVGGGYVGYINGFYIEVYNNGETVQYLDGRTLARGFASGHDSPNFPCSAFERYSNDPEGVWAGWVYGFPGSGSEYPVQPGRAVLIASEAIDHRPLAPGQFDLSRAHFEFGGPSAADNPHVPNMISIGPRTWSAAISGFLWTSLSGVALLAEHVDIAALPVEMTPANNLVARIPADRILDVLSYWNTAEYPEPRCARLVHERFDRQGGRILPSNTMHAITRRPLLSMPDGRVVLQRTITSARDFIAAPPSPGTVP